MRIQFVSPQQAQMANATLSDDIIVHLTGVAKHPIAHRRGLGAAIVPDIEHADIIVVNKNLRGMSPAVAVITEPGLVESLKKELSLDSEEAPKAAKAKKK